MDIDFRDSRFVYTLALGLFGFSLALRALTRDYYRSVTAFTFFAGVFVAAVSFYKIAFGGYKDMEVGPEWVSYLLMVGAVLMFIAIFLTLVNII